MQSAPSSPTISPKRFLQPPTSAPISTGSKNNRKSHKLRSPRPYSPVYSNINYDHVTDRWENFLFLFFFGLFLRAVIGFKSRATFSCNQEKWNKAIVWIHSLYAFPALCTGSVYFLCVFKLIDLFTVLNECQQTTFIDGGIYEIMYLGHIWTAIVQISTKEVWKVL